MNLIDTAKVEVIVAFVELRVVKVAVLEVIEGVRDGVVVNVGVGVGVTQQSIMVSVGKEVTGNC